MWKLKWNSGIYSIVFPFFLKIIKLKILFFKKGTGHYAQGTSQVCFQLLGNLKTFSEEFLCQLRLLQAKSWLPNLASIK